MAQGTGPIEAGYPSGVNTLLRGNMFAVVAILIWAAGFPAAEALLPIMDPLTLITVRFAIACAVMLPLWWVVDGAAILRAPWLWGVAMGGLTFGVAAFLLLLAQDMTDAVTVAIVSASTPLVAAFVEFAFGKRRFTPRLLIGLAAAIVGGIVCLGGNLTFQFGLGALVVVVAGGLYVLGSQLSVSALPQVSPIGRATLPVVGGLVLMVLTWAIAHAFGWTEVPDRALTNPEVGALAVYSIGALALSQIFFIASVAYIGVTMTSFHINTAPLYVMLIMVALGAAWSWPQAIGGLIVVLGAIYVQMRD